MGSSHKTARILFVDDDCYIRRSLAELLRNEGYDAVVAADVHEAMQKLQSHEIDVVITDLMMPEVDGAQFLRDLSLHPRYRNLPTILLTAAGADVAQDALALAEIRTVVMDKPVRIADLLAQLELCLARGQNRDPDHA